MSCSVTERLTARAGVGGPSGATSKGAAGTGVRCGANRITGVGGGQAAANDTVPPNSRTRGTSSALGAPQNGPHSSPQGAPFRSKPCCSILWCCCCKCPCSTPTNKSNEGNGPTKNSNSDLGDFEAVPTPALEEIRSWGKSFDKLMKSSAGRKFFRDFLKGEYSEENILFWLACEDLKRQTNKEVIEEKARLIYEDYISILSPKEVSLDSAVREIVNRNMVEPTPNTFDEAQLQIYTLMHRDSYPRFVNSLFYKTLSQNDKEKEQHPSTTSSVASMDKLQAPTPGSTTASTPLLAAPGPTTMSQVSSDQDQQNGS